MDEHELVVGKSITIGGVTLKLLRIDGRQVKFGIEAPEGTTVYREEIWKRMKAEKAQRLAKQPRDKEVR